MYSLLIIFPITPSSTGYDLPFLVIQVLLITLNTLGSDVALTRVFLGFKFNISLGIAI